MLVYVVKMVIISTDGLLLDGSANAMAGLPTQAFGIMLNGSDIEDMIACIQNGGDIQLSLGSNPVCTGFPASSLVCYSAALHSSVAGDTFPLCQQDALFYTPGYLPVLVPLFPSNAFLTTKTTEIPVRRP